MLWLEIEPNLAPVLENTRLSSKISMKSCSSPVNYKALEKKREDFWLGIEPNLARVLENRRRWRKTRGFGSKLSPILLESNLACVL